MAEQKTSRGEELVLVSIPEVAGEANETTKPGEPISLGPEIRRLVDLAKKDLAARLSISDQQIEMLQSEFLTWRDSSAGCPQPGMQYLQVLTKGSRILLKANNATYRYHNSGNHPPFLCKNPSAIDPLPYQDG
ncbi:MAG: hypothetical protein O7E57_00250 [Gammaproteobacteria bacterium]|nr:hypothetical protein [Gammaproteobacteria bacterium]